MRTNWFLARRLDAIDALLSVNGELRRQDIMDLFGVSMPQASSDIQAFVREYPNAIAYDGTRKRYMPVKAKYRRLRGLSEFDRKTFRLIAGE